MSEDNLQFETNAAKANASLTEADQELKVSEKLPYLWASLGGCFIWSLCSGMLAMYWTDVLVIAPATVSLFLLVSKLWDAVNDPIIGYFADRTQTKWGRYRPWMLSFIPAAITGWLCFVKLPGVSDGFNQGFSMIMYLLYVLFFTMVEVPGNGLVAAATTNPKSRGSIISYRMGGSTVTSIVLGATTLPLIFFFGHDATKMTAQGMFWTSFIFFLLAFPFGFMAFFQVRERVKIPVSKHKISESFSTLKGNLPFWIFFVSFLIYGWSMASGTVRMYYWQYLAENFAGSIPNQTLWGIGMAVGAVSYNFIVKKLKNKGRAPTFAFIGSGVANGILALFMLSAESSGTTILFYHIMTFIQSYVNGVAITSMYGVLPDITEYTQWKYKLRISGFITSILNCSFQFGFAFGMAFFTWSLSWVDYVPNVPQSDAVKNIINLNMHWLPCIALIVAGLVMTRYKISNEEYYKMLHEIAERTDEE